MTRLDHTHYAHCHLRATEQADTAMHAAAFFLADHASVESDKVYTNGAFWNRLNFPTYPTMVSFSVVAVIVAPWRAHHQMHKFTVAFEDADGKPAGGQFEVRSRPARCSIPRWGTTASSPWQSL